MEGARPVNKISRPRMVDIFPRERLFSLLDQAFARPAVWIGGPGGAGKSTLVASYLDSRNIPCIWYQIDEGDADIATLFYYLGLAARKAAPGRRQPLPLFTPEYEAGIATFARRYFEKLFKRLKRPYALVLDDYHEAGSHPLFHEVVKHALAEVPPGINIVMISRLSPPPALTRICAGKQISFLGWEQLRLTRAETEAITQLHGRGAEWAPALRQLHDRIQGWVAGLVLFLERGNVGPAEPVRQWRSGNQTPQEIFNYFAGELFEKTEPTIRDFLLKSSLLPTIVPALAGKLSDGADAAGIMAELHGAHFFTEMLDEKRTLYRFHPLFREFLLDRCERSFEPQQLRELKRRAALLLEQAGRTEEAAALCIDADDREGLADMVLRHAPELIAQGRSRTLHEWLDHLPHSLLEQTPYLLFWSAVALFSSNPTESRNRFREAFSRFRAQGDAAGLFLSWCGVVDTAIHMSEYLPMREWIETLARVRQEYPEYPSREVEVRVALSLFNAAALGLPDHHDIHAIRERAFTLFCTEPIPDANLFLSTGLHLAVHLIYQGDFTRCGLVLNLLEERVKAQKASELVLIMVKTVEAQYAFATCALDDCVAKVFEALELSASSGINIWEMHLYGHALAARLAKGDEAAAGEQLARMAAFCAECRNVDKAYYYWLRAWSCALTGNFAPARHYQELALHFASKIGFQAPEVAMLINMAEICLELGEDEAAQAYLATAAPRVQTMESGYLLFCYLITEWYGEVRRGREERGVELLRRALAIGARHRIENFYFWRPRLMTQLCVKGLERGFEVEYLTSLVRKRALVPPSPPVQLQSWPWPMKIYTLGRFELVKDDRPVVFSGKVQKKPLEMLKALIALGGKESREGELAYLLWPDADGDTARNSFKVTLHRLRELLGMEKALQLQEGRLAMDRRYFWSDAWALESLLGAALPRVAAGDAAAVTALREALALYRGPFLDEEAGASWAVPTRKRLQNRYVTGVVALGEQYRSRGDHRQAIDCYLQGLEVDELAEEIYQNLMLCYQAAGLRSESIRAFERFRKQLALAHGIAPSQRTLEIHARAFGSNPPL